MGPLASLLRAPPEQTCQEAVAVVTRQTICALVCTAGLQTSSPWRNEASNSRVLRGKWSRRHVVDGNGRGGLAKPHLGRCVAQRSWNFRGCTRVRRQSNGRLGRRPHPVEPRGKPVKRVDGKPWHSALKAVWLRLILENWGNLGGGIRLCARRVTIHWQTAEQVVGAERQGSVKETPTADRRAKWVERMCQNHNSSEFKCSDAGRGKPSRWPSTLLLRITNSLQPILSQERPPMRARPLFRNIRASRKEISFLFLFFFPWSVAALAGCPCETQLSS